MLRGVDRRSIPDCYMHLLRLVVLLSFPEESSPWLLWMTELPMSQPRLFCNHCTRLGHKHMVAILALPRRFVDACKVSWCSFESWGATFVELVLSCVVLLKDVLPSLRRTSSLGFESRHVVVANVTRPLSYHILASSLLLMRALFTPHQR